jgi:subtilisin family serine protease
MLIGLMAGLAALAAGAATAGASAQVPGLEPFGASGSAGVPAPRHAGTPAGQAGRKYVPGEIIVGFRSSAAASRRSAARSAAGVRAERGLVGSAVQLVKTDRGTSVSDAIASLEKRDDVLYAVRNGVVRASAVPNDPLFPQEWGLLNTRQFGGTIGSDIAATRAWDTVTGGNALVAVVDTGVAMDHPDLVQNLWTNPGETAGDSVDNDANGVVDDVHGFDAVTTPGDPNAPGNPRDFNGHGTHVAGTIAARGNNGIGIAGVSWVAQLMAVRVLDAQGSGSDASVIAGFDYAGRMGADIVNASLGGPNGNPAMRTVIEKYPNTLFVVAAGNDGLNVQTTPTYPCSFPSANIVCVAATNQSDQLAGFSNFGASSVDLAAPGVEILSTQPHYDTTIFTDTFESNNFSANWLPNGTATTWNRTSEKAAPGGGTFSASDSPGADYANNRTNYMDTVTPVNLSGKSGCKVFFDLEISVRPGDVFVVLFTTDNWVTFGAPLVVDDATTDGTFVPVDLDLADGSMVADGASSVKISFGIESDNDNLVADGVHVDNVKIGCVGPQGTAPASYQFLQGTSMATPHVAGVAALLQSADPSLTTAELKATLLGTVDARSVLAGKTVTGGRMNSDAAVSGVTAPPATGDPASVGTRTVHLDGTIPRGSVATSHAFEYGTTTAYGSSAPGTVSGTSVAADVAGLSPATTYHYRLVSHRGATSRAGQDRTFTTGTEAVVAPTPTPTPVAPKPDPIAVMKASAKMSCTRFVKASARKLRCTFTATGAKKVSVTVKDKKRKKVGTFSGAAGKKLTLKGKGLKKGKYSLAITFTDAAGRKAVVTKTIKV